MLKRLITIIFPFTDFLHLLQLEEYIPKFYSNVVKDFFFKRNLQKLERLKWTSRVQTTFLISLVFYIYTITISAFLLSKPGARPHSWIIIIIFAIATLCIPFYIMLTNVILNPIYNKIKNRIIAESTEKFKQQNPNTTVILVSGSFGKTSTKNFIYQLVSSTYRTQMVPGNINTPIGIAVWIRDNLNTNTQILIVEADADLPEAVAKCCKIVTPEISVITSMGDQHLARFDGQFSKLYLGLSEAFHYAADNAHLIIPQKYFNKLVEFNPKPNQNLYPPKTDGISTYIVNNQQIKLPVYLSQSNSENLILALTVAGILNIDMQIISTTLDNLTLPDRRQKIVEMHGFITVDDSYNISLTTAKAGLDAANQLAHSEGRGLVVITGGIPDLGAENSNYNQLYGEYLVGKYDSLILLKTSLHKEILAGMNKNPKFNSNKLYYADNMADAWAKIREEFPPSKHLVLMQPELGDLYY